MRLPLLIAGTCAGLTLGSSLASAYQIETIATTNCHERITAAAVVSAGFPDGATPPASTDYDNRVISDVPFSFPFDEKNPWMLAVLVGVRNNDIEDRAPIDVASLSAIHNDPLKQMEHCLRHVEDDGTPGDAVARDRCKEFVLAELEAALGPSDTLDLTSTVEVTTNLKFRDEFDINIQRYGFHVGRALHGLQDGYTHTLRNPESWEIRHVLNWIEGNIGKNYVESRDGHEHIGGVDDCSVADDATREREAEATMASTMLLEALADGEGGRAGRLARASAVLDSVLVQESGCTLENAYCDAPELSLAGCSAGGAAAGWLPIGGALGLLGFVGRRRRRRTVLAGALLALLVTAPAFAQPAQPTQPTQPTQPAQPAEATEPVTVPVPVAVPGEKESTDGVGEEAPKSDAAEEKVLEREDAVLAALPDPTTTRFGFAASVGAAYDRPAAHVTAGFRYHASDSLAFGLDVEWNPYFAVAELDAVPGTANIYVPIIWKMRKFGSWELRSTWGIGASVLLFDLVESDKYSFGGYVSWNPLGVAFTVSPNLKVVVKPGDISVPIPEVTGFPYYYHQYRFTVGLEWYP